ncbi:MAG: phosphate signaling complex protein PhoU [Alphaproteobacteria bacterium]|jgi:phosphate transport system protein|nr:phosphate signaling complex protein PhoU [Alphaproteobacteria bacterium]|tara:strand:- start:81 stop:788 length:708 start_codon:yes stop_codon:yes gene_type:complete
MDNNHISSLFDKDLNKLNNNLLSLGNTALDQFDKCINNFGTQDIDKIEKVINSDKILDDLDDKVQKLGFEIIALRAPQAADLRRIIVALKVATIFERIGDYSRNISNRTKLLIELNYSDLPGVNIGKMGQKTQTMFEDVLEAYMNEDDKLAVKVRNSDFKVDKLHTEYYLEIISSMQRNKNFAPTGAHLLFIAKNIERVADYVTDIAEQVYFLVNGSVLSDHRPKADETSLKVPD